MPDFSLITGFRYSVAGRSPAERNGGNPWGAEGRFVQRSLADLKLSTVSKRFEIQYFQGISGFWIFLGLLRPQKYSDGRRKTKTKICSCLFRHSDLYF